MTCSILATTRSLATLLLPCGALFALGCASSQPPAPADSTVAATDQNDSAAQQLDSSDQPASLRAEPDLSVPAGAGNYPAAFDAAKSTLRDMGFMLERVDAQGGVITTQPKGTGGLATPWDREQSGVDQELDDMFHRQQRIVRIQFIPRGSPLDPSEDLRTRTGDIDMFVQPAIVRWYKPGRRINTSNVLASTYTDDPALEARGLNWYSVAQSQDTRLAARIAERVQDRLAAQPAQAAAAPDSAESPDRP